MEKKHTLELVNFVRTTTFYKVTISYENPIRAIMRYYNDLQINPFPSCSSYKKESQNELIRSLNEHIKTIFFQQYRQKEGNAATLPPISVELPYFGFFSRTDYSPGALKYTLNHDSKRFFGDITIMLVKEKETTEEQFT